MSKIIGEQMPEELLDLLVGGNPVVIVTVDQEGWPYAAIVGSCVAIDRSTLRFAAWPQGQTIQNIRDTGRVFVETLGTNMNFGIKGIARVVKPEMDASPFPPHQYMMVEIHVSYVKDDHPPGSHVEGMSYYFTRQAEERLQRRNDVTNELKLFNGGKPIGFSKDENGI